jgi:hypothetical protein
MYDENLSKAKALLLEFGVLSVPLVQRRLKISAGEAQRLISIIIEEKECCAK